MSNCSALFKDVRQVEHMMDNSDADNAYVMNSNSLGFETWWWHCGSAEQCRRVKPNKQSIVISNNGQAELGKWNKRIWLDVLDSVVIGSRQFSVWTTVSKLSDSRGPVPVGYQELLPRGHRVVFWSRELTSTHRQRMKGVKFFIHASEHLYVMMLWRIRTVPLTFL